jgi:hypothetical protein
MKGGVMRRGLCVAVATITTLGFAVGSVALASPGPAGTATQVIHLISRATAINDFVDVGPAGFTPGDLYVFSDRLFTAAAPDDQIGRSDGRCVLIDPATFRFDCSITTKLPDGELMVAGTLTLVEGATSVGAIVGGTGEFSKARGEGSLLLGPFEGPHEVTIKLVLNP